MNEPNDLIIIGGGPAGVAAGIYASRKLLKSVLIADEIGGQSTVSEGIQNWVGTVNIPGAELKESFKRHLEAYKGEVVKICEGERVSALTRDGELFTATTNLGNTYQARAVLIASGAARRRLAVPGADQFEHKGLTYCASCDGPLFAGADVAVVGGGNAGLETAAQLLAYCKTVTVIHRNSEFKADPITVKKVLEHPNLRVKLNSEPAEVKGEKFVTGLVIKDRTTGALEELAVSGIFIEIGVLPNTDFAKGLVALDSVGRVITNPRNQHTFQASTKTGLDARQGEDTSGGVLKRTTEEVLGPHNEADGPLLELAGVWAAGDCTDELYHQNNIAAGDAVKALEDIYVHLKAR